MGVPDFLKSEDLYERLNAVRPAVSRVTILPTK